MAIELSENWEPPYIVLEWEEDFHLDAHVDSDGQQRFAVMGYIQKREPDGIYQAPLIPELFFGANGQQLTTWSQYLTAGDHEILRRDGGNPSVPDHELAWRKVYSEPSSAPPSATPTRAVASTFDLTPLLVILAIPIGLYALYKLAEKLT